MKNLFGEPQLPIKRKSPAATVAPRIPRKSRAQEKREKLSARKEFIPNATVYPNAFHIYNVPAAGYNRTQKFIDNQKNLRAVKVKGELSEKARKRIENAIQWLLLKSQPKHIWNRQQQKSYFFRLNFITVTLPAMQAHEDSEVVKVCLNNFLNILRKNGLTDYLWRAEAQVNGNIHFHITTNTFFHWQNIRDWWNSSVNLLGYVDRFELKHKHRSPNSTDIRKVKHVRKLAAYLSKYMAKEKHFAPVGELRELNGKRFEVMYDSKAYHDEDSNKKVGKIVGSVLNHDANGQPVPLRKISARLWACSQSISKSKPMRFDANSPQWNAIRNLSFSDCIHRVAGDYVDSYYGNIVKVSKVKCPALYYDLISHAKGIPVSILCSDDKLLQYLE